MAQHHRVRQIGMSIRAFWLALLRRLLHLWIRSTIVPEDLSELELDRDKPTFYVLDSNALSSLLISDQICRQQAWHMPSREFRAEESYLPRSHAVHRRYNGWFIRTLERRRHSPILRKLVEQIDAAQDVDVQIVPVTVLIGRAPENEAGFFKSL